ncbi:hypothetical protein [Marinobacterium marinum]|uniref:Uncharacterized protein n=1 Tax=Marinobacterium marinum TaxID=2756129 RepID=A0A7W2ABY5_9GAMM|nr:hypothetical protein [Marinobacterium marinum]MBA4503411.1 hypothetical protein [Marinobacterium marinum]
MRKLGTLLGALVLVTALAYGLYWYQVKSRVDELVQQASPFASVQYDAIYAHPDGTVGVNGLRVSPHPMHAPFEVGQVRLNVGGPMALILSGDEPPAELTVSFKGFAQSLESGVYHEIQKQFDLAREANPLHVNPAALGCGSIRQFDINTLRMMGYRDLLMDVDFHYRGDEVTKKIHFDTRVNVENMGDTQMELVFSADPRQLKTPLQASGNARLHKALLGYRDRGYNQRLVNMCAMEAEVRPADYRALHVELVNRWLSEGGVELPQTWLQAYEGLQQSGATLTLEMNPIGGFGSSELAMTPDPDYMIEKLNPTLVVNDTALDVGSIAWGELVQQLAQAGDAGRVLRESERRPSESRREPAPAVDKASIETVKPALVPEPQVTKTAKRFRETPVAQLKRYIGAHVRIETYFGNRVEGRLKAVEADGVRVVQRLAQGVAEYPLEHDRIQKVEVYR